MPPFLPVRALNRSQQVRIGGQKVVVGTTTYVDLGDVKQRRELAQHSAYGAVIVVGAISTTNADVIVQSGVNTDTGASASDLIVRTYAGILKNRQTAVTVDVNQTDTTIATADGTNPRIDLIVVDNTSGAVTGVTGTAAASPVAPATPAGKTAIASVAVAASTTAIINSNITDLRPLT